MAKNGTSANTASNTGVGRLNILSLDQKLDGINDVTYWNSNATYTKKSQNWEFLSWGKGVGTTAI